MYDSVEDIDTPEDGDVTKTGRQRFLVGLVMCLGLLILIGVAIFSVGTGSDPEIDLEKMKAEKTAYLSALTEPSPALRRARLTDFLNVYIESSRTGAARAQLQVLNRAESEDWAVLTNVIFDTRKTKVEKFEALEVYEAQWTGAVLGGRGEQLTRIRDTVEAEVDDLPDRDLPIEPDDVPDADVMVGGEGRSQSGFETITDDGATEPFPQTNDVITPPELRRNIRPNYPRRALQRDIEALIVLRLFVNERGRVDETELVMSQAERYETDFIRAAERAARRTRFRPKTINGQPVADNDGIVKRYRFQIEN